MLTTYTYHQPPHHDPKTPKSSPISLHTPRGSDPEHTLRLYTIIAKSYPTPPFYIPQPREPKAVTKAHQFSQVKFSNQPVITCKNSNFDHVKLAKNITLHDMKLEPRQTYPTSKVIQNITYTPT